MIIMSWVRLLNVAKASFQTRNVLRSSFLAARPLLLLLDLEAVTGFDKNNRTLVASNVAVYRDSKPCEFFYNKSVEV